MSAVCCVQCDVIRQTSLVVESFDDKKKCLFLAKFKLTLVNHFLLPL